MRSEERKRQVMPPEGREKSLVKFRNPGLQRFVQPVGACTWSTMLDALGDVK